MMRFVLSVLLLLCSAGIVGAGLDIIEVGKHGDVYPVVEPDPAEEISRAGFNPCFDGTCLQTIKERIALVPSIGIAGSKITAHNAGTTINDG